MTTTHRTYDNRAHTRAVERRRMSEIQCYRNLHIHTARRQWINIHN